MGGIWAIILAAGESRRMGFPKMLLNFKGKTMIETVIGNIKSSGLANIIVVLGANHHLLTEIVVAESVKYCYNNYYQDGMLSSVKCGFRNLPSDMEAAIVFQGDQPLIKPSVISCLIDSFRTSGKGIIMPVFENKRGHPLLISCRYRNEVDKLDAHFGLRSLAYQFPDDVLEVETEEPGILRDFDTYGDYIKEITQNQ